MLTKMEILALSLANNQNSHYQLNQPFWWLHYRVDPKTYLADLVTQGYLTITKDPLIVLPHYTVAQLKTFLRFEGLKISGRKADLVRRINQQCEPRLIGQTFSLQFYQVTELGAQILRQNSYLRIIHNHYAPGIIDYKQAGLIKLPHSGLSERETIMQLLVAADEQAVDTGYWSRRYLVAHLTFQNNYEWRRYGSALSGLLQSIAIELAGLSMAQPNFNLEQLLRQHDVLDYRLTYYKIEDYYVVVLKQLMTEFNLTLPDILANFSQLRKQLRLPFQLFSDQEMDQIIGYSLAGDELQLQHLYGQAQQNWNKKMGQ
ncbi:SAP domain-containing protein [Loigolactobacillus backii]|uniref:SAP domain-containing protein n=1 Tax=Loigolactobacillus backii TaxID=375175 RepID=UPI000C1C9988|nr:SAP domain-containing protein [Loigolactobacillus backii]MDA5388373.1 SAP domain-containing protein [Loigolactobacillus backii]MDA5391302.1 SAP domain-containing protein [Loigolactobacillus backii]PIO84248.1 hypothetical protein BSQ39_12065 [Loigolactobacillus backii]